MGANNTGNKQIAELTNSYGQLPPQAIDFEEEALGALILEYDVIGDTMLLRGVLTNLTAELI